jgi:fermentation-respiration switch protein FrsA (DUF1100 family)
MRGLPWLRKLIYFPTQDVPPIEHVLPGGEEVVVPSDDGLQLRAWFLARSADPAPTVLVLHGNGGNRADRAALASALAARGYAVLLSDYRGYGGNSGRPDEQGLAADARGALAWLDRHPRVDGSRIALFGESLGAAVAVGLASEVEPAALILRSPFTSLGEIARHHYPGVPTAVLPDRYPTIDRIPSIGAPTMVIAGDRDEIVPLAQSERVFAAASEPKRLLVLPGVDHNDLVLLAGERMIGEVASFLADAMG